MRRAPGGVRRFAFLGARGGPRQVRHTEPWPPLKRNPSRSRSCGRFCARSSRRARPFSSAFSSSPSPSAHFVSMTGYSRPAPPPSPLLSQRSRGPIMPISPARSPIEIRPTGNFLGPTKDGSSTNPIRQRRASSTNLLPTHKPLLATHSSTNLSTTGSGQLHFRSPSRGNLKEDQFQLDGAT